MLIGGICSKFTIYLSFPDDMSYYCDTLVDLENDEVVEEEMEERAEKALNQETRRVMRLNKRLKTKNKRKRYY